MADMHALPESGLTLGQWASSEKLNTKVDAETGKFTLVSSDKADPLTTIFEHINEQLQQGLVKQDAALDRVVTKCEQMLQAAGAQKKAWNPFALRDEKKLLAKIKNSVFAQKKILEITQSIEKNAQAFGNAKKASQIQISPHSNTFVEFGKEGYFTGKTCTIWESNKEVALSSENVSSVYKLIFPSKDQIQTNILNKLHALRPIFTSPRKQHNIICKVATDDGRTWGICKLDKTDPNSQLKIIQLDASGNKITEALGEDLMLSKEASVYLLNTFVKTRSRR